MRMRIPSSGPLHAPGRQSGVALVLALLVVALVTAISVELSWRFDLGMTRAANRWYGVQADAYLRGAEEFAFMALRYDQDEDRENGKPVDKLGEVWAQPPQQFPVDEGWIRGGLEDAQGRFNINLLQNSIDKKVAAKLTCAQPERYTENQRRFIRLLQTIEVEEDTFIDQYTAMNITAAIIDWIDIDSVVTCEGAESDYYSQLEPPFVIPNKAMVSVSELNVIQGITPVIYQKLLPLVIALPPEATLNVNTMPLQLLRTIASKDSLYPNSEDDAQYIYEERGGGYDDLEGFKSSAAVDQVVGSNAQGSLLDLTGLGVASSYFIFNGDAMVGDYVRERRALIHRDDQEIKVLRRTDANF